MANYRYDKAAGKVPAAYMPNLAPARSQASSRAMAMREAYSNGVRCKGFAVTINATQSSSYTVDLSGMAKNFLGFAWYFTTVPTQIITSQLVINNDVIVDTTLLQHFLVNGSTSDRDYYPFPRPLNGQDTIVWNFVNGGAIATGYLVVYYI